jgi:hypothetical protein
MTGRPILSLRIVSERSTDRAIILSPEPFGQGLDVTVSPPCEGIGHDAEFPRYRDACDYARRLSRATGWRMVDRATAYALADHDGGEAA